MATDPVKLDITTDSSGNRVTLSSGVFGYVDRIEVVLGTATSLDLTLQMVGEAGDETFYAASGIVANVRARPTAGWKFDGQRIEATVANGGNAKTATVYVHFSDKPLTTLTIAGDLEIGAIEIKNATDDTRAKVVAGSSAAVGDNALVVADANVASKLTPGARTLGALAKTVTTPGTAVALTTTLVVRAAWVRAKKATGLNAGKVFIGTSAVNKDTDQQHDLDPDEYWEIPIPFLGTLDLATVYIDAVNAGDGVTVQYLTA